MKKKQYEFALEAINVIAELERYGAKYVSADKENIKTICPFHEDSSPSFSIHLHTKACHCLVPSCAAAKGCDFITFLARFLNLERRHIVLDLATKYPIENTKTLPLGQIETYYTKLKQPEAQVLLQELYNRGITDEMIKAHRIGFDGHRITIPIFNETGQCVNIRKYLPGAPAAEKMRNTFKHGAGRLYPIEQLKYPKIVICGGELKAVVTAGYLNEHNIGAICTTGGEGFWKNEFSERLREKTIYVMLDIDEAGRAGSAKICSLLLSVAAEIFEIVLPLDKDKYPKGDINDYVGREKQTNLLELITQAKKWTPLEFTEDTTEREFIEIDLSEVFNPDNLGRNIACSATVNAVGDSPYLIPKIVLCNCTKDQAFCHVCPVFVKQTNSLTIPPHSPAILSMVGVPKKHLRDGIREGLKIPPCKVVTFTVQERYVVEDVRISPQLGITTENVTKNSQSAVYVGSGIELNETYRLFGTIHPHPRSQQGTYLIEFAEPIRDALSKYNPEPESLQKLQIFQTNGHDDISQKLNDIYTDLSANVTRIFDRTDMHLIMDLVYHSPLFAPFDEKVEKGWLEALIVGDSSQGKSETIKRLIEHYGLGEKVDCKNATSAGLLGGLQKFDEKWFISWGIIPTHDRRMVILEELKGASTEIIAKLTDMRSSGIAEIPRIEKRRTHARTRLLALSNPRASVPMAAYNFGVEAITELIGGLEDIRRFDIIYIASVNQVSAERISQLQLSRPQIKHTYTAELCRALILWAWTRTEDQIISERGVFELILQESERLCNTYTEIIPIVDRGSMRLKIFRLSAALAVRLFSCVPDDLNRLLIKQDHVRFIVGFLNRIYSSPEFGYRDFSETIKLSSTISDPESVKKEIRGVPYIRDFIESMLGCQTIELRDIMDWCAWDKEEALRTLSLFVRKHALIRENRGYRKTPDFIKLLREMRDDPRVKELETLPDHIKNKF